MNAPVFEWTISHAEEEQFRDLLQGIEKERAIFEQRQVAEGFFCRCRRAFQEFFNEFSKEIQSAIRTLRTGEHHWGHPERWQTLIRQVHWLEAILSPYELRLAFTTNEVETVQLQVKLNSIRYKLNCIKLALLDLLAPTDEVQELIFFYRDQNRDLIAKKTDLQRDVQTLQWMLHQKL